MIRLRQADEGDAAAIAAIYAPFVRDTAITFETEIASEADIGARMRDGGALYPWIVAEGEADGALLGYAYASGFRPRAAYRFAVETTVYVDPEAQGRGAGEGLYRLLVATLTEQGYPGDRSDRASQPGQRQVAREARLRAGGAVPQGGLEARRLARCRPVAAPAGALCVQPG